MAIPKYDEMMLPILRFLADGTEHSQRELADKIADQFKLNVEERAAMLPKVRATYLRHRVGWAGFGLRRAGLADNPRTGTLRITEEGRKFLDSDPHQLRAADLKRFPAYASFLDKMKSEGDATVAKSRSGEPLEHETPEERMGSAFAELNATLVTELLSRLGKIDPFRFEQVVLDLLVKMG